MKQIDKQLFGKWGIINFVLILFVWCLSSQVWAGWTKASVKQMVINEAQRQDFPEAIALAVAEVESDFDPSARSHVDARGVMQILPTTAEQDLGVDAASLYNPRVNIRAGVKFLKHLVSVYDGRVDIALSHYNGGSRVRKPDGSLQVLAATRKYVDKVLNKAHVYQTESYQTQNYRSYASKHHVENTLQRNNKINVVEMSEKQTLINKLQQLAFYNQNRNSNAPAVINKHQIKRNDITKYPKSTRGIDRQYESKVAMRKALVRQWEML